MSEVAVRRALAAIGVTSAIRPLADPQRVPAPVDCPPTSALATEMTAVWQLPRLFAAAPRLALAPRGAGGVVVDVPGWRSPESYGAPLRAYLRRLGHDARGWGFGTNHGTPERDAQRLADSVTELAERSGGPVALIGWSLGGLIAREVARTHPEVVRHVVTYGTPVVGGPTYTRGADTFGPDECARAAELLERLDTDSPITVPVTAILSRRDGVVTWTACVDRTTAGVEHLEVTSPHVGLGFDPDVWHAVATALAVPARDRER